MRAVGAYHRVVASHVFAAGLFNLNHIGTGLSQQQGAHRPWQQGAEIQQGLIPVKLLAFDQAVNTSLGLPFLRTSPDHGTGFDIAGLGIARAASMVAALEAAEDLG